MRFLEKHHERDTRMTPNLPVPARFPSVEEFLHPDLDSVIMEIERETEELRGKGRLASFVEGEPLGEIPHKKIAGKHRWKVTRYQTSGEHNEEMEQQRRHTLALRRKNDTAMRRILQ